ncbi:MAG: hypothetical protein FJX29_02180 [Alphaproteobacteria bacterium]|nr:hypothetical protein [Alphaproteobacteria bacterium]
MQEARRDSKWDSRRNSRRDPKQDTALASGRRLQTLLPALACLGALAFATSAAAQAGADFFKGKTITYIVPTSAGGGYDVYGRLVSEFMQKHLPGSTFVVRNMPGAAHILGTNTLFASRPDGLTIGTFNMGLLHAQVAGSRGVKFDLRQMSWIGKAAADPRVFVAAQHTGIKDFRTLLARSTPLKFAASGAGGANYIQQVALIEALKIPAQVLTGYNGNDDKFAMRRGEIDGTLASRSTYESFVREGHAVILAQIGGSATDAPPLIQFALDGRARALVQMVTAQSEIARLTAGPPGIAPERLATLRTAFSAAMADPIMRERAAKLELPLEPMDGQGVTRAVAAALEDAGGAHEFLKQIVARSGKRKD